MGVATGCGFKEIYRFPHTTYPYSSCICTFWQQHPYFCFHFVKMILHSYIYTLHSSHSTCITPHTPSPFAHPTLLNPHPSHLTPHTPHISHPSHLPPSPLAPSLSQYGLFCYTLQSYMSQMLAQVRWSGNEYNHLLCNSPTPPLS